MFYLTKFNFVVIGLFNVTSYVYILSCKYCRKTGILHKQFPSYVFEKTKLSLSVKQVQIINSKNEAAGTGETTVAWLSYIINYLHIRACRRNACYLAFGGRCLRCLSMQLCETVLGDIEAKSF